MNRRWITEESAIAAALVSGVLICDCGSRTIPRVEPALLGTGGSSAREDSMPSAGSHADEALEATPMDADIDGRCLLPDPNGCDSAKLTEPVEIDLGADHSCARLAGGTVRCWGANSNGQLGDGTTIDRVRPTLVSGFTGVIDLAVGGMQTCAVLSDHTVRCWGGPWQGGDGTGSEQHGPVAINGLVDVAKIAVDGTRVCALLLDQTVSCWMGSPLARTTDSGPANAQPVPGLTQVADLVLTPEEGCAILADQTAMCWGSNIYTPSGGSPNFRNVTVPVALLAGVGQLALGNQAACALLTDEAVYSWGVNSAGQLGNGSRPSLDAQAMARVPGLNAVAQIAAGGLHNCALFLDGKVSCWGWNLSGELGDASHTQRLTPTPVAQLSGVAEIALGTHHSCARLTDGSVKCWGANDVGQLGNGTTLGHPSPTAVVF